MDGAVAPPSPGPAGKGNRPAPDFPWPSLLFQLPSDGSGERSGEPFAAGSAWPSSRVRFRRIWSVVRWVIGSGAWLATCLSPVAAGVVIPEAPPNWRMELIARAPGVNHPSVVCTAPDGRVFVAEDPMDISAPRADAQEGRVLCFRSDDTR